MPEVKIPKVALPAALREMTVDDVIKAIPDVRIELPRTVDLSKLELPKVERPKVDLSKVDLPKVEMPDLALPTIDLSKAPWPLRRKRSGPPWAVIVAVLAGLAAGAWVLLSSPATGPRIRTWMYRMRTRLDGSSVPEDVRPFPAAERADERSSPYADEPERSLDQAATRMTGTSPLAGGIAADAIGTASPEHHGVGSGAAAGGGATTTEPA